MKKYSLHKVNALPDNPIPDSIYFVKNEDKFKQVLIDSEGNPVEQARSQEDTVTPPPGGEVLWFESYAAIEETPGEVDTFYVDNSDGQIYIWTEAEGYKPEGEKVRVRPDWVEQDPNHPAYIFNKPTEETLTFRPFISTWNVAAGETIALPLGTTQINDIEIDWGDGTIERNDTNNAQHTYATAGTYQVKIKGRLDYFGWLGNGAGSKKITGITQWGDIEYIEIFFNGCTNLTTLPTDVPNFLKATSLRRFLKNTGVTVLPNNLLNEAVNVITFFEAFRESPITSIPGDIFNNCLSARDFEATFQNCNITTIPPNLFRYSINAKVFKSTFRENPITFVDPTIFSFCEYAEYFDNTFFRCDIQVFPNGIHDNNLRVITHDEEFRYNRNMTGVADKLWVLNPNADSTDCFQFVGQLSNYAEIPTSWGGPPGVPMPAQVPVLNRDFWNTATDQPQWLIDGVWKSVSGSTGAGANVRLSNLAGDLSAAEKDSIKNKIGVTEGGTSETAASIKTKYESNTNTNAFTDALQTKLNGITAGANNYTHPANHPPSIITQNSSNRFVTDAEKTTWNGKAAGTHVHAASDITSGTFVDARIPSLNASKTTAGTFNIARIPTGTTGSTVALGNHVHSYNDLTDKPNADGRTNKMASTPYTLIEGDKDKILNFQNGGTVSVNGNLMVFGERVIGVNASDSNLSIQGTGFEGGGVIAPTGSTKIVKPYGSFSLTKSTYDPAFLLSGDLLESQGSVAKITSDQEITLNPQMGDVTYICQSAHVAFIIPVGMRESFRFSVINVTAGRSVTINKAIGSPIEFINPDKFLVPAGTKLEIIKTNVGEEYLLI